LASPFAVKVDLIVSTSNILSDQSININCVNDKIEVETIDYDPKSADKSGKITMMQLLESFEMKENQTESNYYDQRRYQHSFEQQQTNRFIKSNSIDRSGSNYSEENLKYNFRPPYSIIKSSTQTTIASKDMSTESKLTNENLELKQKLEEAQRQIDYLKSQLIEQATQKSNKV